MTSQNRWTWLPGLLAGSLAVLSAYPAQVVLATEPGGGFTIGFAVGALLVMFYWHPYRVLGFLPPATTVLFGVSLYSLLAGHWVPWLLGLLIGLSCAGFRVIPQVEWRREWPAPFVAMAVGLSGLALLLQVHGDDMGIALVIIGGLLALFSWGYFLRPFIELSVEPPLWSMYRIRGAGPALRQFPVRGPCLVIANHACWFDPLFLAKVLPHPVTPMMTSRFYDLPVLRWVLRRVFRTIRVPEKPLKQDVPEEIQQAIAALDRGACVVIFPEGYLRRSEQKPLKRFGRGVWQILQARPDTPVFACWIEGGWGSYASYFNGRPTQNKRPDFRRPIGVSVTGPVAIDPETSKEHLPTRVYLMNRVIEARKHLGLPDLPAFELPSQDEKEDEGG